MTDLVKVEVKHAGQMWPMYRRGAAPLALDLDIAAWLEFEHPRRIRSLIDRYAADLGDVLTVDTAPTAKGGRPGQARYLTEEQALFIAAKSETPKATQVLKAIIAVFVAARNQRHQLPEARPQGFADHDDFIGQSRDAFCRILAQNNEIKLTLANDRQSRAQAGAALGQRLDGLQALLRDLPDLAPVLQAVLAVDAKVAALAESLPVGRGPVGPALTTIEVARKLGLTPKTFRGLCAKNPDLMKASVPVGGGPRRQHLRWDMAKVDRWFRGRARKAATRPSSKRAS